MRAGPTSIEAFPIVRPAQSPQTGTRYRKVRVEHHAFLTRSRGQRSRRNLAQWFYGTPEESLPCRGVSKQLDATVTQDGLQEGWPFMHGCRMLCGDYWVGPLRDRPLPVWHWTPILSQVSSPRRGLQVHKSLFVPSPTCNLPSSPRILLNSRSGTLKPKRPHRHDLALVPVRE